MDAMRLDRRRAESELHDQAARLSAIVQIQGEIARADLSIEEGLRLICQRAQDLTGASGAGIELLDGEWLVHRAGSGLAAGHEDLRLPLHDSLSGIAVKTGEPQCCTDSYTDPRANRSATEEFGMRAMMLVPLEQGKTVIGVLKILYSHPREFSARDITTLQLLSPHIALALSRAAEAEARKILQEKIEELERANRMKPEFPAMMRRKVRAQ